MNIPKPQSYLNKAGVVIYEEMCRMLIDHNALEDIDSYGLSMAAHWLWLFHDAGESVKKNGGVQTYTTGAEGVSAHFTVMKTASAMFKDLSAKFGLSNKDRELMMKFKGVKQEKDDLDDI